MKPSSSPSLLPSLLAALFTCPLGLVNGQNFVCTNGLYTFDACCDTNIAGVVALGCISRKYLSNYMPSLT